MKNNYEFNYSLTPDSAPEDIYAEHKAVAAFMHGINPKIIEDAILNEQARREYMKHRSNPDSQKSKKAEDSHISAELRLTGSFDHHGITSTENQIAVKHYAFIHETAREQAKEQLPKLKYEAFNEAGWESDKPIRLSKKDFKIVHELERKSAREKSVK